jgi:hypothetical protein
VVDNGVVLEAKYTPEYKTVFRNATEIVKDKIMNETSTIATDLYQCRCKASRNSSPSVGRSLDLCILFSSCLEHWSPHQGRRMAMSSELVWDPQ